MCRWRERVAGRFRAAKKVPRVRCANFELLKGVNCINNLLLLIFIVDLCGMVVGMFGGNGLLRMTNIILYNFQFNEYKCYFFCNYVFFYSLV